MINVQTNDFMTATIGTGGILAIQMMALLPPLPVNFAEYNEIIKTFCQISVAFCSIYFMYKNNKKKDSK